MPQAIEVAYYQLGTRLTQCQELHERCTADYFDDVHETLAGPEYVVLLRHLLRGLRGAFDDLARISKLDTIRSEMGSALISQFDGLWGNWAQLSTTGLHDEYFDGSPYLENVSRFKDFVRARLIPRVTASSTCEQWFRLGENIADGYWHDPGLRARLLRSKLQMKSAAASLTAHATPRQRQRGIDAAEKEIFD